MHPYQVGRTLPLSFPPAEEETFRSYMNRLAAYLDVPLIVLLQRLGILARDNATLMSGYGLTLPAQVLQTAATALRISEQELASTFLTSLSGPCCDLAKIAEVSPRYSYGVSTVQWVYFRGSNLCPECLSESGGVWKLRWKLPWCFACVKHGRLLADFCPGCTGRIESDKISSKAAPAFPRSVPTPLLCSNAVRNNGMAIIDHLPSHSGHSKPCGYPLTDIVTRKADATLLVTQKRIEDSLNGERVQVLGEQVTPADYFEDLRAIVKITLSLGSLEALDVIPECVKKTLGDDLHMKGHIRKTFQDEFKPNGYRRSNRELRMHVGTPNGATISAAAITVADGILNTCSVDEAIDRFKILGDGLKSRNVTRYECRTRFKLSERLDSMTAFYWRSDYWKQVKRPYTIEPFVIPDGASRTLTLDHIAQSFWKDQHLERLWQIASPVVSRTAYPVFSVWAAMLVSGLNIEEVCPGLGIPPNSPEGKRVLGKVGKLMGRRATAYRIDTAIRSYLTEMAFTEDLVDYGSRREKLRALTSIDREVWVRSCAEAGVHPGKPSSKSSYAATWLWCELTGGHYPFSPSFLEHDSRYRRESYRRFVERDLTFLKEHLIEFGETLV